MIALLEEQIRFILRGIDHDEIEDPQGWWETSSQCEFGAKKLEEVLAAIREHGDAK